MSVTKEVLNRFYQGQLNIGNRLRYHRKLLNLTIDQVSEMLEITPSYYGLIERNGRMPSIGIMLKICSFYNFTLDYLVCNHDNSNYSPLPIENWITDLNPLQLEIIRVMVIKIKYHKLDVKSLQFITSFIEAFIKLSDNIDIDEKLE